VGRKVYLISMVIAMLALAGILAMQFLECKVLFVF